MDKQNKDIISALNESKKDELSSLLFAKDSEEILDFINKTAELLKVATDVLRKKQKVSVITLQPKTTIQNKKSYEPSNFGWNRDLRLLEELHTKLEQYKFIVGYPLADFKAHFLTDGYERNPIPWKENKNELVYLFQVLRENNVINSHSHPHIQLEAHFVDRYKKILNANSLRTLLNKGVRRNDRMEIIKKVLKNMNAKG